MHDVNIVFLTTLGGGSHINMTGCSPYLLGAKYTMYRLVLFRVLKSRMTTVKIIVFRKNITAMGFCRNYLSVTRYYCCFVHDSSIKECTLSLFKISKVSVYVLF